MASAASMASAPATKRCGGLSWPSMVSRARASLAGSPGCLPFMLFMPSILGAGRAA
ncbi:hypothetical protein [Amycolatopsis sp. NPDC051061]|uniref:hypothetical protein n=1 Tax=Amycolatopsis sp. NPDC051061 TaxID=3155042 RepID=UPI00344470AC